MQRPSSDAKSKFISLDGQTTRKIMPQRYPMLLLDRVKAYYYEEPRCVGIKNVSHADPVLAGHFPDFPIYPGVLIIEALAQSAGVLVSLDQLLRLEGDIARVQERISAGVDPAALFGVQLMVLAESRIKHTGPVYPGDQMELEATVLAQREGMYACKVRALVNGQEVSKGQVTLARPPWTATP